MNVPHLTHPEDFGVADSEYLHRLGFTNDQINRGLYSEQVNEGLITSEDLGIIRSI